MNISENLSKAIHNVMNDVVEQCFRQIMEQPAQRPYIEGVINQASRDIQNLTKQLKTPIDRSTFKSEVERERRITIELYERSLAYLAQLQNLKRGEEIAA